MVCLGNICRSPLADGLMRKKIAELNLNWEVDSAGTSSQHQGEAPDSRMIETAEEYGLDISNLRARGLKAEDLDNFDEIFVMDSENYKNTLNLATENNRHKVKMILNETYPNENRKVPDPYFGGKKGFVEVYELLNQATDGIIDRLKL